MGLAVKPAQIAACAGELSCGSGQAERLRVREVIYANFDDSLGENDRARPPHSGAAAWLVMTGRLRYVVLCSSTYL